MIVLDIDLLQLNDLYYAVSKHTKDCKEQIDQYGDSDYFKRQLERAEELEEIVQDALHNRVNEMQEAIDYIDEVVEKYEDEGPKYDSAGYSEEDRFAAADVNVRVGADEFEKAVNVRSHFVTNEEADEDAKGPTISYRPKTKSKFNGVSQAILDMVERQGSAQYSDMNNYYRKVTGSNTFHAILKALMIPYKNRPTRRYIRQIARGTYVVDYANQYNWVVSDDRYNYND